MCIRDRPISESLSNNDDCSNSITSVGTSLSITFISPLPLVKPIALALIRLLLLPSAIKSSTAETANVADAVPAGINTLVGTVVEAKSLLVSVTVIASVRFESRVTVAVLVPPFSAMLSV